MTERVIEIAEDGRWLSRRRGFMKVSADGEVIGQVPLDDIACLVITARGVGYSNSLVTALAERGAGMVICGQNFLPVAWLWPLQGNHLQGERMGAQMAAGKPMAKRAWQAVTRAKIRQQAAVLNRCGKEGAAALEAMAERVKSGDPDNLEAQAARRFWPALMGPQFRRDTNGGGANGMLNYSYAVLRAATARAIVGAGLHPSIGIHHHNIFNHMRLADDLMEPFRPLVDLAVVNLLRAGVEDITPEAKQALANVLAWDLATRQGASPTNTCIQRLATSLAQSFVSKTLDLALPIQALPLEIGDRL